jgi:general secretion pathway protein I
MADRTRPRSTLEGAVSTVTFSGSAGSVPLAKSPHLLPSCGGGRRQAGFSLLEVVVAFAILALSLGLLMQVFSRALSTTALSGDYSRATTLAQSHLDAVGVDIPLEPGSYSGEPEDGLSWQVLIEPYELGDIGWEPAVDSFLVTAVISWGEGGNRHRRISLSTLRLASPSDLPGLTSIGESVRAEARQDAEHP